MIYLNTLLAESKLKLNLPVEIKNIHKLFKVILDSKIIKSCEEDLSKITGQKPIITKFKKL